MVVSVEHSDQEEKNAVNNVEEMLTATAKRTLAELQQQGVAEDDWQFNLATYSVVQVDANDPGTQWECTVSFKKAVGANQLLQIHFRLTPSTNMDAIVRQEIIRQFQEHQRSNE
jgi:hypothetical protein